MIRKELEKIIEKAAKACWPSLTLPRFSLEAPSDPSHGDYAANLALVAAKKLKKDPLELAANLETEILKFKSKVLNRVAIVKPGFINFFLDQAYLQEQVTDILKEKEKYGNLPLGKNRKIQVEFISANPTGPLTVGNARGGFWGDVLGNVLRKAGFDVEKAYYVNDYGMQVLTLGHSVLKDEQAKYQGQYIDELNAKIKGKDPYEVGEAAARFIIGNLILKTVGKMGIRFNEWVSETWLHQSGRVKKALDILKKNNLLYEKEEATWFKSSALGDQRDRVVVKQNDWYTYLAGDAGLHYYKFSEKKFDKVINVWGADHFGDVAGLQAVVEALGHKGKLDIILLQFVTLFEKGERLKMSKRAGVFITMDELLDLVGADSARFFFLQKSTDTHLNFDVDLAKEQSEKNPVFYVQYAFARICSLLRKTKELKMKPKAGTADLKLLNHPGELSLIKQLARFPEVVEDAAEDYQIQRLPQYALELAASFHQFYRDCRVISEDKKLTQSRLFLIMAVQIVLKNTLDLMGVSAPEKM